MKRLHWMTAAVAALAVIAPSWAAPAPSEKSPLGWVPADAPVVIHANGPQGLRDHVLDFLKNALPDQADRAEKQIDQLMNNLPGGRKIAGLAKDGPVFVALLELPKVGGAGPDITSKMAIVAAVTNYAEFRDNILSETEKKSLKSGDGYESATADGTGDIVFVDKKDYVVVTPSKDVAAAFVKGAPGLDGKMGKEQAAKFLAGDLGLYVDMEAVNKEYGEQIKAARKTVDELLDKLEETLGKAQKSQFETVKKMIGPIFQSVEDAKTALFTAEIRTDGVRLHAEAEVRSGTPTADLLKTAKAASFPDIGKLPAGQVFYTGMELDPTLLKFAGSLLTGLTSDPDAKGAKEFTEAFDDWTKAGPSEAVGSVTYPIAGLSVMKCTDPEKAVAAAVKMMQSMGSAGGFFQNMPFKDKPEIKPNAEKYGAVSFTSVHMVWDLDKMMSAAGAQLPEAFRKQMVEGMKQLMGEEINSWLGTDGKVVIQVTANDWESAKKTLDQYYKDTGTVGEEKGFAAVRKQLPEQASVVVMMDVVQYTGDIIDFLGPVLQSSGASLPAKFPKAVKDKPGFLGVAITMESNRGGYDVAVPADTVKLVYESYVSPLLPKD
jgi:hypothetical protein